MALTLVITNAGRAALVNATNTGTAPSVVSQIGFSATAITPVATATSLPGEIKRVSALSGDVVAPDTIHVVGRDESAAVYTVRSLALYLADGTLFGLYGQSTPIAEKAAQAILLLAVDVRLADIAATSLTFGNTNFLNPPATETVKGVAEIATQPEVFGAVDDSRIVTPKKLYAAVLAWLGTWGVDVWRASNDGAGSGLDSDLLDGQQGSWYSNIIARLGFTPVNKAGDDMTGTLTHTAPNGIRLRPATANSPTVIHRSDGDYYFFLLSEPGAAPSSTYNALRPFFVHLATGRLASENGQVLSGGTVVAGSLTLNASTVWAAGNDGAGSGLDADLLDGQQGSWYADIPGRLGYAPANRAGDSFTGTVVFTGTGDVTPVIAAPFGFRAYHRFRRLGSARWDVGMDNVAEGGGNVGSNYLINRFTDAGAFLETAVSINRATGIVTIAQPVYRAGNIVWDAGNDGAGSGLDADLLDGLQASDLVKKSGDTFTGDVHLASGRALMLDANPTTGGIGLHSSGLSTHTGFTGFYRPDGTRAGYVGYASVAGGGINYVNDFGLGHLFTGGRIWRDGAGVWDAANDGAGSGLDSDLLDGQQGIWYTDILARLGWRPVRQGGGPGQLGNLIDIGWSGTRVKAAVDGVDQGNLVLDSHIANVWRVSNDGSGSGLDADLLDGQHASAFARADDLTHGANGNGTWRRYPIGGGSFETCQRGGLTGPWSGEIILQVTFPVPFASAPAPTDIMVSCGIPSANIYADLYPQVIHSTVTATGFSIQLQQQGTQPLTLGSVSWQAIASS